MSLVVVGSVAYDGVQTPHGQRERMLGGACTYVALAASYFTRVGVVGVVGEDFDPADRRFLEERGIDLAGLEQKPGKTFYWSGVYSEDMNDRVTLRTELNVFGDFQPELPPGYRRQPYLFLGNIQPELQRRVREQMESPRLVGGDTMNYWIESRREALLETLAGWHVLLINDSEARLLSGERNLRRASERIRSLGPRILVIKRGEHGAVLFADEGPFLAPAYPLDTVADPTGAGDCFAGGFFGYLAEQGADLRDGIERRLLRRAVIYGSVMGSFCCERFGVERFRTLTRAEIDARFKEFKELTEF
ncbi:MAG: PfkB family carbohydrate kinase [Bryobacterales bacterium]|nr:PfkB family carbohydrate kinase [Bryobacteraceae bacterium]MDW8131783.1 PfkB family carbohydrate kinase [Bryobacterales bacterium]